MPLRFLSFCLVAAILVSPLTVAGQQAAGRRSGARSQASAGLAGVEAATKQMLAGQRAAADAAMRTALGRWVQTSTQLADPRPGSLEADALAIRDAVFLPLGNSVLRGEWNAEGWPASLPPFLLAAARLEVHVADRTSPVSIAVSRQPPGFSSVVFVTAEDVERLTRLVSRLGGTARREPAAIMEIPNQPSGPAERIIAWWNGFFPARPGHWSGVEIESAPAFDAIAFTDVARTRAEVKVRIGYAGATVVLEKTGGTWTMRELIDQWVM
jgi:hypothetical protein